MIVYYNLYILPKGLCLGKTIKKSIILCNFPQSCYKDPTKLY